MRIPLLAVCVVAFLAGGFAAAGASWLTVSGEGGVIQMSEKGIYRLEMIVPEKEFKVGTNSVDLVIRDTIEGDVTGADVTVTPWMPGMGHGVSEKPVVTEKGGGLYGVDNIVLIMPGHWQLRVLVRRGDIEDSVIFDFPGVGEMADTPLSVEGYERAVVSYEIPDVTLLSQNREKIRLRECFNSDKPVMVNFIFTTCTTICPVLAASFANLQGDLGPDSGKVRFVSISIDPEHDTPEEMKKFLADFKAKPGWDFLTGKKSDIELVMRAFDAYVTNKMTHQALTFLHNPGNDRWIRIYGFTSGADLMKEYEKLGEE